jgi:1-acyl-sn-glycerol-3-phosphate acyltransferase
MIKVLIALISLLGGLGLGFIFHEEEIWVQVLASVGFTLATFIAQVLIFILVLYLLTFHINKNKEVKKQSPFYRRLMIHFSNFLHSLFSIKTTFVTRVKPRKNKNYIVVCNHRSNLDSLIVDRYFKDRPMTFIGKQSLFKIPFVGKAIHKAGYVKIDREHVNKQLEQINGACKLITNSKNTLSLGIFPEGTRNFGEGILPFKNGAFFIAKKTKTDILISVLEGSDKIKNNLLFKKHPVKYTLLEILSYEKFKDMSNNEIGDYCKKVMEDYLSENE